MWKLDSPSFVLSAPNGVSLHSLSNSCQHLPNADMIANMKSKIIVSHQYFFADMIICGTSKVQNYQNKTGEKSHGYYKKYMVPTYFKEF